MKTTIHACQDVEIRCRFEIDHLQIPMIASETRSTI